MLEIICIASLTLSTNVSNCPKLIDSTQIRTLKISQVTPSNSISHNIYLAKGKPYKSRYRQEADRYQERYREDHNSNQNHQEINGAEVRDGRIYRDADSYRRESGEIGRDERNRDSKYYQQERYRDDYIRWNRY